MEEIRLVVARFVAFIRHRADKLEITIPRYMFNVQFSLGALEVDKYPRDSLDQRVETAAS